MPWEPKTNGAMEGSCGTAAEGVGPRLTTRSTGPRVLQFLLLLLRFQMTRGPLPVARSKQGARKRGYQSAK
jgi:hypothetical protein